MSALVFLTQGRDADIKQDRTVIEMQPTAPYLLPLFNHVRQVLIFSTALPAQTLKLVTVLETIPAKYNSETEKPMGIRCK